MVAGVLPISSLGTAETSAAETTEAGRQVIDISSDWKFYAGKMDNAQSVELDDSEWENINIPHTWNALDGQDGGGDYRRGDGWYRKVIPWNDAYEDKQIFIEFLAANMQADVYVNGEFMGNHKGGYTAFRYDITQYLNEGEENLVAVRVNNEHSQQIAPLSADFTFWGGIYREVSLVLTDTVHVDTMDYGSSGLKLTPTQSEDDEKEWNLNVAASIVNNSTEEKEITVTAVLRDPESFTEVPGVEATFDVSTMYGGDFYEEVSDTLTIPAGESMFFSKDIMVYEPRLWNGTIDPYRYQVDFTITQGNAVVDSLTDYVGFRYYHADYDKGFFLNGKSYKLRGVCRHQDREDMGNAITVKEHNEDFAMIYDMGANAIRLAHYPQAPYFYEMCDKYGLVVWAEIPFVNEVGGYGSYENPNADRAAFFEVTKQQLIEMIRQQYNRPSILFWGLQNEVRVNHDSANDQAVMDKFMVDLSELAHAEDPTGRITVQATDKDNAKTWESDLIAWNRYPAWYMGQKDIGDVFNALHAAKDEDRPMGISEYGIGSRIDQHCEEEDMSMDMGKWQPEEYQNKYLESFIADIESEELEYLWASFYWNMFDFSADQRTDAGLKGINTKGLVSRDRKTKKDAFFLYKAYWSENPVAYITSRRFTNRENAKIPVKVYSNCDKVTLYMNGKEIGTLTKDEVAQDHVFIWKDVMLTQKQNTASIVAEKDGKVYTDSVIWNRASGEEVSIQSETLRINEVNKTVVLPAEGLDAGKVAEVITSDLNSFPAVYEIADGELKLVEAGEIEPGMILRAISEDRTNSAYYTFVSPSLAAGKEVTFSSEENKEGAVNLANNIVDGDASTRWAASDGSYPQYVQIDLGEVKQIRKIASTWFAGNDGKRAYKYKISVANEADGDFTEVADKTGNTTAGYIEDDVNVSGRYVRIDVTGNTGNASIYEIEVFGEDYPEIGVLDKTVYEAEAAAISGACQISDGATSSGGKFVGNMGNGAANALTFTVEADEAGPHDMDIYYLSGGNRSFEVTVNGGETVTVECKAGSDWDTTILKTSITVELQAGSNTIVMGRVSDFAPNLDRIEIGAPIKYDKDPKFPTIVVEDPDAPGEGMTMHRMDAESGVMENGAERYEYDAEYAYVTKLGGKQNGKVTLKVSAKTPGLRKLRIYYCQMEDYPLRVIVNGQATDAVCENTGAWFNVGQNPVRMDIWLNVGENEIILTGVDSTDTPYVDYVTVELTQAEVSANSGDDTPQTPPAENPIEDPNPPATLTEQEKNIVSKLGVTEEAAKEIKKVADTYKVDDDTLFITDKAVTAVKRNTDIKGTDFLSMQLKVTKQDRKSVRLSWKKVKDADGYLVYGAKADKKTKFKKLTDTTKTNYTNKGLKKGTAYKYLVVAYKKVSGSNVTLAASKTTYTLTTGGKNGVAKKIVFKNAKKSIKLKVKGTYTLKTTETKKDKKIKNIVKVRFESSNPAIATVSKAGKVKGIKKGNCYIYAYAQNGISARTKVTVR